MADISCLKEVVPRAVCDGFVGHDVFHLTHSHLSDSRAQMIMITNVSAWSDCYLSNPQFIFALQFRQVSSANRSFV